MTTKAQPETAMDKSDCTGSPTGAHHWVLGAPSATMTGECKYCHKEREFSPFEDNTGFNNSPKKRRASSGGVE